jgi:hypothetical protein
MTKLDDGPRPQIVMEMVQAAWGKEVETGGKPAWP